MMSEYVDPDLTFFCTCYLFITLQIKAGDVCVLANTSLILVKEEWSSEIRLHAFKMLQVCPYFLAICRGSDFLFHLVTLIRVINVYDVHVLLVRFLMLWCVLGIL